MNLEDSRLSKPAKKGQVHDPPDKVEWWLPGAEGVESKNLLFNGY